MSFLCTLASWLVYCNLKVICHTWTIDLGSSCSRTTTSTTLTLPCGGFIIHIAGVCHIGRTSVRLLASHHTCICHHGTHYQSAQALMHIYSIAWILFHLWLAPVSWRENVFTLGTRTCGLHILRRGTILVAVVRECVSVSIFQFTRFESAPRFMRQYMQNLNIFIHIHAHRINMMAFKVRFVEFCAPKSYSTTLTPSHAFPPTFETTSIPALVFILTAVISSLNSCSLNMHLQLPLAFTWTAFLYDPASSLNVVIDLFLLSLLAVFLHFSPTLLVCNRMIAIANWITCFGFVNSTTPVGQASTSHGRRPSEEFSL